MASIYAMDKFPVRVTPNIDLYKRTYKQTHQVSQPTEEKFNMQ